MIYKCKKCGKEFKEPRTEKEVIGADNQTGIILYYYCPYCDSSNIQDVKLDKYYWEVVEDDE